MVKGNSDVRFRLKFGSGSSSTLDGFQIDNFQISGSVLPLSDLQLFAQQIEESVEFEVMDAGWLPNTKYILEKANADQRFVELDEWLPESGNLAGSPLMDMEPIAGKNYYRIKRVYPDGSLAWSDIETVSISINPEVSLYPNPVQDIAELQLKGLAQERVEFQLINLNGQVVFQQAISPEEKKLQIDLSQLPTGVYMYLLTQEETQISGKISKF